MDPAAAAFQLFELPRIVEIPQRPVDIMHPQIFGPVLFHARSEAFPDRLETDHHVGNHFRIAVRPDAGRDYPRQKLAVAANIGDQIARLCLDGTAKFHIEDEGSIIIDQNGARESDEEADVTLTASAETFKAILDGEQNPTTAFMTGKLTIDGDMGKAMQLAGVLA